MRRPLTILLALTLTLITPLHPQLSTAAQIVMSEVPQYKGPADARCLDIMGVPLEGPDSVFIPAFEQAGFERVVSDEDEPDTYYFRGEYYGIRSNLIVSVDEHTKLLASVLVTSGPYRTFPLFDRNNRYFLLKLQRHYGNFSAKGDGSLHTMTSLGYVKLSNILHADKLRTIQVFYLNTVPYYKDAQSIGLKGHVQEVITENPVTEAQVEHYAASGKSSAYDIVDRQYNAVGYLVRAAMPEPSGHKSQLQFDYDDLGQLVRRTLTNVAEGIKSVSEYTYNDEGEVSSQSQKVFDKSGECILSINIRNEYTEHDDNGNWTQNDLRLIYWEKGLATRNMKVRQKRTISYWEEE